MSAAASKPSSEEDILNDAAARPPAAPKRISAPRLFLRALGVSFISVLSLLIAICAFTALPQVQDILLDARPYWVQEALYWTFFYLLGILVWALPLVFAARLLLLQHFDLIGVDTEERFKFYIFVFPRFFALFAFAAVLAGMISASGTLPMPMNGNPNELVLRRLLTFHLIALCIATVCIIVLIMMRNVFISYYRRRMEAIEHRDSGALQKSLLQIENAVGKPDRNQSAPKPEFLTEATWVAAQQAERFMWTYMCCLCGILAVLVAINFLSYSDTLRGLFTLPEMTSYPKLHALWHFYSRFPFSKSGAVIARFAWRLGAVRHVFWHLYPNGVTFRSSFHSLPRVCLFRCSLAMVTMCALLNYPANNRRHYIPLPLPNHLRLGRLPAAGMRKGASSFRREGPNSPPAHVRSLWPPRVGAAVQPSSWRVYWALLKMTVSTRASIRGDGCFISSFSLYRASLAAPSERPFLLAP